MALALRRHLRTPLDPHPEETILRNMASRNSNFLSLAKRVLAQPEHPYAQLFEAAGCTYCDVEVSVQSHGLEETLQKLLAAGVYVSHEEFRGRKEIVRGGRHIPSTSDSWLNAPARGGIVYSSSGSSGRPVTTDGSSEHVAHLEACLQLLVRELDLANRVTVNAGPILPGFGVFALMLGHRLGLSYDRWYAVGGKGNLVYRALTHALVTHLRWCGVKAPYPIYLDHDDFTPVAEYVAGCREREAPVAIGGFVSAVARIAAAATDKTLDLRGCIAILAGEALTDAKRKIIAESGIDPYPTYGVSEFGSIGYPCRSMNSGNCVHVMRDAVALTVRQHELAGQNSLCLTSLLPSAPRIAINMEIGDTGVIEATTCDCSLRKLGLDLQVRGMAAISKVTAQGVTIAAADLVELLEEKLPGRFGGRPGDYQLLEREAGTQTEMVLRIRPDVTKEQAETILTFFLAETKRLYGGSLSVRSWVHSNGIQVEFADPVLAGTGKFRAIRLLGSGVAAR